MNTPQGFLSSSYFQVYPYVTTLYNLGVLIANIYSLRFPRRLHKSIILNDEFGANQAFRLSLKAAYWFLIVLVLNGSLLVWGLIDHTL